MSKKPQIHNYASAAEYLGKKTDRPLHGKATRLIRINSKTIGVKYHYTFVVTYHEDGRVVFHTGGYNTKTTRRKFDEYCPLVERTAVWDGEPTTYMGRAAYIGSSKGQLYIGTRSPYQPAVDGVVKVMHRTATLHPDGSITTDSNDVAVTELKRLRKLTKDYAAAYVELFIQGDELRECETCNAVNPTVNRSWQSGGEQVNKDEPERRMDPAHLILHMDQKQYPIELLRCAMNCFGSDWQHKLYNKGITQGLATHDTGVVRRDFPTILRRFLRRELGLECTK